LASQRSSLRALRRFVDWEKRRSDGLRLPAPWAAARPGEAGRARGSRARALFRRDFGRAAIVAFGEVMTLDNHPAIVAEMRGEVAGALAYRLLPDALHVVALATDPMWQRSGVASHLVEEAEVLARRHGLRRLVFATTNDNLPALYFYQRRGWTITEAVPGAMVPHVRTPDSAGFAGIPVREDSPRQTASRLASCRRCCSTPSDALLSTLSRRNPARGPVDGSDAQFDHVPPAVGLMR
jgi:ribosomal protein S18 acetylase RimI-like enzyme